jgi:tRNA threonylcarbamoyladenosine biosynthesis protein TsaE
MSPPSVVLSAATTADAADVLALTRAVFTAYADVQPQPTSLRETVADVERDLAVGGGLVVRDSAGALLAVARFTEDEHGFWLRRVAVDPAARRLGLGSMLLAAAEHVAISRGHDRVRIGVRLPLVAVQDFWRARGFHDVAVHDYWVELERRTPVQVTLPTADDTADLGRRLSQVLRAGDLVLLSGELGAGKTTLTRGLGAGLGVRGAVTSPTFVIVRVHPALGDGPALVHADAYRITDLAEVDDLDLDASMAESVTVVEWGDGKVEGLAADRLEVVLHRGSDEADETRTAAIRPIGPRWAEVTVG